MNGIDPVTPVRGRPPRRPPPPGSAKATAGATMKPDQLVLGARGSASPTPPDAPPPEPVAPPNPNLLSQQATVRAALNSGDLYDFDNDRDEHFAFKVSHLDPQDGKDTYRLILEGYPIRVQVPEGQEPQEVLRQELASHSPGYVLATDPEIQKAQAEAVRQGLATGQVVLFPNAHGEKVEVAVRREDDGTYELNVAGERRQVPLAPGLEPTVALARSLDSFIQEPAEVASSPQASPDPPAELLSRQVEALSSALSGVSVQFPLASGHEVALMLRGPEHGAGFDDFAATLEGASVGLRVPAGSLPREIMAQVLDWYSQEPALAQKALSRVTVAAGGNPTDAKWSQDPTYSQANQGGKGFTSAATGGNGEITLWNGGADLGGDIFHHEMGHVVSQKVEDLPGTLVPKGWPEAMRSDGIAVSRYARLNADEDFAESWAAYLDARRLGPDALALFAQRYPARSAFLTRLLTPS